MGLLDSMFGGTPEQQGLLAGYSALLQSGGPSRMPISLGQGLGQAFGAGQKAYQDAQEFALQKKMREAQMAEMQAKADEAKRQRDEQEWLRQTAQKYVTTPQPATGGMGQFNSALPPEMQAPVTGAMPAVPGGFNAEGFLGALSGRDPLAAAKMRKELIPAPKLMNVAPGNVVLDEATRKPVFTAPDKSKEVTPTDLGKLIAERDRFPEGHPSRKFYDAAILKASTHQPGVSVSYGAPVAGQDAAGNPVFFQPAKGGGAPAIIPGVAPPAGKLGEKQANQISGIDSLGLAVDNYTTTLKSWKPTDGLNPNKRAEMGTAYNNMMLQAKEAYNLGVLNGPDFEILQQVVRNPMTVLGSLTSNEALAKQAMDLKREMNKIKEKIQNSKAKPKSAEEADPLGLRGDK